MNLIERLQIAQPTKVNEHGFFAQCDLLKIFERDMRLAASQLIFQQERLEFWRRRAATRQQHLNQLIREKA